MSSNFTDALKYMLANEGGFVNRAEDKGGPTKYGITQNTATLYFKKAMTADDMKNLTVNEASEIYLHWFWKAMHLDQLDSPAIATCLFDTDVNMGQQRVVHLTEEVLKTFHVEVTAKDTWMDTIKFLNCVDPEAFIEAFHDEVIAHYEAIVAKNPAQGVFMEGWKRRAERLLTLVQ